MILINLGSALVRFERLILPDHKGTRNIALRILKILTPVKCVIPLYDGYIVPPKEGELHRRSNVKCHRGPMRVIGDFDRPVWSADIDKSLMRGLQLLWDT